MTILYTYIIELLYSLPILYVKHYKVWVKSCKLLSNSIHYVFTLNIGYHCMLIINSYTSIISLYHMSSSSTGILWIGKFPLSKYFHTYLNHERKNMKYNTCNFNGNFSLKNNLQVHVPWTTKIFTQNLMQNFRIQNFHIFSFYFGKLPFVTTWAKTSQAWLILNSDKIDFIINMCLISTKSAQTSSIIFFWIF